MKRWIALLMLSLAASLAHAVEYGGLVPDQSRIEFTSRQMGVPVEGAFHKYIERDQLRVEVMGRGFAWLDTGTHESLIAAATFIEAIETRQGLKVACPEEIAYRHGFISADQVRTLAEPLRNTQYGKYLLRLLDDRVFV